MKRLKQTSKATLAILFIFLLNIYLTLPASTAGTIHHELEVKIFPDSHYLEVTDTIHLPAAYEGQAIHFLLHGNLAIASHSPTVAIHQGGQVPYETYGIDNAELLRQKLQIKHYVVTMKKKKGKGTGSVDFYISYKGEIHHPLVRQGAEYARGFSETAGIISEQGVYLANASFWIPEFPKTIASLITFQLKTNLPAGWDSVSQGNRILHEKHVDSTVTVWDSPEPMDEIFLVAAKFHEYSQKTGAIDIMAFLRTPDQSLAQKYLDTTGQYIDMYEALIGPYPYNKFALVENFWETGYGMPSFTLLGPKIIRFPFILHSSYPHELLHNWWGNSVFVDYGKGNWCEGLTVYLADHLIKEQRGQASEYRRTTLQSYSDYVNKTNDFPIAKFHSRFDAASSAIGYGKAMMVYHMLRTTLGDKKFIAAIQSFYNTNRFRAATFENLRQSFESVTGTNLAPYFNQWTSQTGAPALKLKEANISSGDGDNGYILSFTLLQTQTDKTYNLTIPVAVTLDGHREAQLQTVTMDRAEQNYIVRFAERPLRVDIDPNFDLFRRLHPNEIPPALSNAFGAEEILIILPSRAPAELKEAYKKLAASWSSQHSVSFTIQFDNEIASIPATRAVWIFGNENLFKNIIQTGLSPYEARLDERTLMLGDETLDISQMSVIAAVRHPLNPNRVAVFLSAHSPEALSGLGRKLPHYGKYSYLAFSGTEPINTHKGQWPTVDSPLTAYLGNSESGEPKPVLHIAPVKPLAELPPAFSGKRMLDHIQYLASEDLEGRAVGSKGIEKASHYIAGQFKAAGLLPAGDRQTYIQQWDEKGPNNTSIHMRNIIGAIPGSDPKLKNRPVILCAHYDHLGVTGPLVSEKFSGRIHPGADDNASGIAALIELARSLSPDFNPTRPILFIAFTGEESGLLGSKHFFDTIKESDYEQIFAAVNLDTVGRLRDQKLKVIGASSAREWRFIFMGIGFTTGIQTDLLAQELESGDHATFIRNGIPAIQLFSGAHSDYHTPADTADKIDASGLGKVATVANELLLYLSQRTEPLAFTGKAPSAPPPPSAAAPPSNARNVKTGVMPDFSFTGRGVRAAQVALDSAAQKAGLEPGDIIIQLGPHAIESLQGYAAALKQFKPGDTTTVTYLRNQQTHNSPITLEAR